MFLLLRTQKPLQKCLLQYAEYKVCFGLQNACITPSLHGDKQQLSSAAAAATAAEDWKMMLASVQASEI